MPSSLDPDSNLMAASTCCGHVLQLHALVLVPLPSSVFLQLACLEAADDASKLKKLSNSPFCLEPFEQQCSQACRAVFSCVVSDLCH